MVPTPDGAQPTVLIFENDPRQAKAYLELFSGEGYRAELALPSPEVQALCERLQPDLVLFDMAIWEADTALVYGMLTNSIGFKRPVIIALCILPHQIRRARRFGAERIWVRGVDDAAGLPSVAAALLRQREEGKLAQRMPSTPL
jgi:CheY-like chemotaxis protein